ncbi:MAG: Mrp/NBP35 family ATP-binding protein [Caldisericia bacterium]|jgi:ATP-binding protein involved in chromosome partitioning|nr:Mrp/NBP35 family ATP-binding protein [Caldisericia bacterium]
MNKEYIIEKLKEVKDPEINKSVVELNMIRNLEFQDKKISLDLFLTIPNCPLKDKLKESIENKLKEIGFEEININLKIMEKEELENLKINLNIPFKKRKGEIKKIVAIASGKGGVGKSTVTTNLAVTLSKMKFKVGVLDADINGPNIPLMFGIDEKPGILNGKILPIEKYGVKVISIGFFMENDNSPVLWRGPLISKAIEELFEDVLWENLDFLLIDLPPGTGDETLTVGQSLSLDGVLIVTTPQDVSILDATRSAIAFNKLNVPIIGVIENMSYFICPDTGKKYEIFGSGGGEKMSKILKAPLLGKVPIEINLRKGGDTGFPIVVSEPDSASSKEFYKITELILKILNVSVS